MALDPEQSARLLAAKLRALVDGAGGGQADDIAALPGGCAWFDSERAVAWVLIDDAPALALGRALAWALVRDAVAVEVVVSDEADLLARRALPFALPVRVRQARGRDLVEVEPAPVAPPAPPPGALDVAWQLVEAGAEVVVEHGVVAGEVNGLEVARIVEDPGGGGHRVEVGVGHHDREAFAMLHAGRPTEQSLAEVVAIVGRQRQPGAAGHPLNRLAPERWLRRWLIEQPEVVGAVELEAVEPTVPRRSLQDAAPAIAVGRDPAGEELVVAASAGIDLDLVPAAADARAAHAPEARLVLAVPERDDHPVTRRLAGALRRPAEIVRIEQGWR